MRYNDYKNKLCEVDLTSQSGDVYTFKGPWKLLFIVSMHNKRWRNMK